MKTIILISVLTISFVNLSGQNLFQKYIQGSTYQGYEVFETNEGLLHVGKVGNSEGFCLISETGNISWQYFFDPNSQLFNSFKDPIGDFEFLHVRPIDTNTISVFHSMNFNIQWERHFNLTPSVDFQNYATTITKIKKLNNGNVCVIGYDEIEIFGGYAVSESPFIFMFDGTGNLLWSKLYQAGNNSFKPYEVVLVSTGNILLFGNYYRIDAPGLISTNGFGSLAINASDGSLTSSTHLNSCLLNGDLVYRKLDVLSNLVLYDFFDLETAKQTVIAIKYNSSNAEIASAKKIETGIAENGLSINDIKTEDGETYMIGSFNDGSQTPSMAYPLAIKADNALSEIEWVKKYGVIDEEGVIRRLKVNTSTLLLSGEYDGKTSYLWSASKEDGTTGCDSEDVSILLGDYGLTSRPIALSVVHDEYLQVGLEINPTNDNPTTVPEPNIITKCSIYVGIDNHSNSNYLRVFPNPVVNNIYFSIDNVVPDIENHALTILNSSGQVIYKEIFKSNNFHLDLSDYSNGIYYFKLTNGEVLHTGKFVIK